MNQFELDASDLNLFAAFFHAISMGIDLAAKYDFNFKVYDYINLKDEGEYTYSYTCSDWSDPSTCNESVDNDACNKRKQYAQMLDDHLYKKTQSTRTVKGTSARDEITKVATLLKAVLSASNTGKFFNFSAFNSGAKSDVIKIAEKIIDGSGNLSEFIKPSLVIDLNKALKDVTYRTQQIKFGSCNYDDYLTENEEHFIHLDLIKYITGQDIFEYQYDDEWPDESDYSVKDTFDAEFSSGWGDFDVFVDVLNPHDYLGYNPHDYTLTLSATQIDLSKTNNSVSVTVEVKDENGNPPRDAGEVYCIIDACSHPVYVNGKHSDDIELSSDGKATFTVSLDSSVSVEAHNDGGEQICIDGDSVVYEVSDSDNITCYYDGSEGIIHYSYTCE